jgi:hypothetical protein
MVDSPDIAADLIFAKTPLGQAEIQQRTLRLPLLTRRVLLLVDGRRAVSELLTLAGNAAVAPLLAELEALGCIERSAVAAPPAARAASVDTPAAANTDDPLAGLPPAQTRTPEQVDMARHFMINTINRLLEQNSRLTLVEKIFNAVDAADLRSNYGAWEEAIGSNWQGKRRLPELRDKLFAVL